MAAPTHPPKLHRKGRGELREQPPTGGWSGGSPSRPGGEGVSFETWADKKIEAAIRVPPEGPPLNLV